MTKPSCVLWAAIGLLLFCLCACSTAGRWRAYPLPEAESPLRDFSGWRAIVAAERASSSFGADGLRNWPPKAAAEWRHLRAGLSGEKLLDKARIVNAFFNQQPYVSDRRAWGVEEHWARPVDFMRKGGDCEDYAIAKYFALRDAGVPAEKLRIAGLWNRKKGEGHAVLVLLEGGVWHALDNEVRDLTPLADLPWYRVYYFLNEDNQWTSRENSE